MCTCNYRSACAPRILASKIVSREHIDPIPIKVDASCQEISTGNKIVKCFREDDGEFPDKLGPVNDSRDGKLQKSGDTHNHFGSY